MALDQPYYFAGDAVTGTLYMQTKGAVEVEKIYLKVKGKEKVRWKETWTQPGGEGMPDVARHAEYDENEAFFKDKVGRRPGPFPRPQHPYLSDCVQQPLPRLRPGERLPGPVCTTAHLCAATADAPNRDQLCAAWKGPHNWRTGAVR